MITEEHFFLQILSDFLHNQPTQPPSATLHWDKLAKLAKAQQVEGILFTQCQSFIPPSHFSRLAQGYSKTLFYYANRTTLLDEVTRILNEESIPFFLVKGTTVANLYPIPALRTMGDSDLVVHRTDKERVHTLLLNLGFECHSQYDHEWCYFKNKMEIELHHDLLYDEVTTVNKHKLFINDCWSYVHSNELDWNFHLIFLLLHLRKHMMNSGVGFRQFMDIAVIIQRIHTLDWNWIYTTLNSLGLKKTATVCFGLIAVWFDIHAPEAASLSTIQVNEATEKILVNGVFGFHDNDNSDNYLFNIVSNSKYPRLTMLQRTLQAFFPSYEMVYNVEYYSFIRGRKWLLPAVWIYRAQRGIRHFGIQRVNELLKSSFVSSKVIKKKTHNLENFGMKEEKK